MDYDMSMHHNPDALAWAKLFMKTYKEKNFEIDEALMLGWFANAMMAMHDHLRPEYRVRAILPDGSAFFVADISK